MKEHQEENQLTAIFIQKKIKTPVCFFDETGLLNNENDKFFILGMIKGLNSHKLNNFIRKLRDRNNFYDEINWKKVNKSNLHIIKQIIDKFLNTHNISFHCIVLHKTTMDFRKYFNNNF